MCAMFKNYSLYDPNNFYYCRYSVCHSLFAYVYMTQTISTIVDGIKMYYNDIHVYMTQTISTIVDKILKLVCSSTVYMTQTISTIVD